MSIDPVIETMAIQAMASEAFDMALTGKSADAALIFSAINQVRPESRAINLGLALVELIEHHQPEQNARVQPEQGNDPLFRCLEALVIHQQGNHGEARLHLQPAINSDDPVAINLANTILNNELGSA